MHNNTLVDCSASQGTHITINPAIFVHGKENLKMSQRHQRTVAELQNYEKEMYRIKI